MNIKRNKKGQLSLYDAFIYFMILLLATTIMFFYSFEMQRSQDFQRTEDMIKLTEEYRQSIVRCTVPRVSYIDKNGNDIHRYNLSIETLILEKLYLLDEGIERDNISYTNDIYKTINNIIRGRYEWALVAVYERPGQENLKVNITSLSGGDPLKVLERRDVNIYSSSWSKEMILEKQGIVRMDFLISPTWAS